jgi:transcriptional regulator with XRE-family HTH domain
MTDVEDEPLKSRRQRRGVAAIDAALGRRIRRLRRVRRMSQSQLAQSLDMTFQQVQKYEAGKNRISVAILFLIARALDTSVALLSQGLDAYCGEVLPPDETLPPHLAMDQEAQRLAEGLDLMRRYNELGSDQARELFRSFASILQAASGSGAAFALPIKPNDDWPAVAGDVDDDKRYHYLAAE